MFKTITGQDDSDIKKPSRSHTVRCGGIFCYGKAGRAAIGSEWLLRVGLTLSTTVLRRQVFRGRYVLDASAENLGFVPQLLQIAAGEQPLHYGSEN